MPESVQGESSSMSPIGGPQETPAGDRRPRFLSEAPSLPSSTAAIMEGDKQDPTNQALTVPAPLLAASVPVPACAHALAATNTSILADGGRKPSDITDEKTQSSGDGPAGPADAKSVSIQIPLGGPVAGNDGPANGSSGTLTDPLPVHNKSKDFKLFSTARPHMRGFHYSWISCVACFFAWFSMSPLLASVKKPRCADPLSDLCMMTCAVTPLRNETFLAHDHECAACFPLDRDYGCGGLGLTENQIFVSNAVGVCGTLFLRLLGGPIIDRIGAKRFNVGIMFGTIWAQYWLCFVNSYEELVAARFFVSFLGASFVGTSAWCAVMFDKSIVGLVGATATGWGKVGAGVSYLVIPLIYKSLKDSGFDNEYSWRRTLIIPPSILVAAAVCTYFFSDASPDEEEYVSRKSKAEHEAITSHVKNKVALHKAFATAGSNYRTWVMGLLFFASNGVDICMGSVVAYYFKTEFHMHQSEASLAGSSFGLMNLFARSLGGLLSDKLYLRQGLFGRVIATFICTVGMGIGLLVFTSITQENGGLMVAILVLMITSIFTQAAQGACYGIVPTINPQFVGAVSGIVGAGGNLGAIVFNLLMAIGFRQAWTIIGYGCIFIGFTVFFVAIPDADSRKIIRESLKKHMLPSGHRRGAASGPGREEALSTMVVMLAEKDKEISRLNELVAGLASRLSQLESNQPSILRKTGSFSLDSRPRHEWGGN